MAFSTRWSLVGRSLHSRTALLEACDWDEVRAEELLDSLAEVLNGRPSTRFDLTTQLRSRLPSSSEEEIGMMMKILEAELQEAEVAEVDEC